jgi:hypothetical protein
MSYAVAWQREGGPRLVGSATPGADGILLVGRDGGSHMSEERLLLDGDRLSGVEVQRSSSLPAVSARYDGRAIVIEILFGGWGAAHHLADDLARPAAADGAGDRMCTVALAARIEPGRRADLEQALAGGLPGELAEQGVREQEVSLGDDDLLVVLTGPERVTRKLSLTSLGLGDMVSSPRLLTQTFSWRRGRGPASAR